TPRRGAGSGRGWRRRRPPRPRCWPATGGRTWRGRSRPMRRRGRPTFAPGSGARWSRRRSRGARRRRAARPTGARRRRWTIAPRRPASDKALARALRVEAARSRIAVQAHGFGTDGGVQDLQAIRAGREIEAHAHGFSLRNGKMIERRHPLHLLSDVETNRRRAVQPLRQAWTAARESGTRAAAAITRGGVRIADRFAREGGTLDG